MDLCFLMKRHSVRKKKKYHLVLKNRRCCLLFRLDKAWLVQKVEKMNTRSVFIFHREREVYFPQQQHPLLHFGWSQGRVGGGEQMEKTDKKRTLLFLVLKQIQETCEGPAHQEERFPPTLLHTGQLSEHTA